MRKCEKGISLRQLNQLLNGHGKIVIRMKKKIFTACLLVILVFSLGSLSCSSKPAETAARPYKIDAELAQKLLTEGNSRFVKGGTVKKDFASAGQNHLQKGLGPFAVIL